MFILSSDAAQAATPRRPGMRPWEQHGVVDIEALVHWAYAAQMVERFERTGLHAIEAAAAGFEVRGYSGDGVGQLMQINHLGCRIDNGGVLVSDAVHPVAYAVARALQGAEGSDLVRTYARSGTRPSSWVPPVHRVRPAMWKSEGRDAVVEYQGPGRKGGYCQLIWVWDAGRERWGRDLYQRWWTGLEALTWQLSKQALRFAVTGPAAPFAPWLKSEVDRPISLDGGTAPPPPSGSSQPTQT